MKLRYRTATSAFALLFGALTAPACHAQATSNSDSAVLETVVITGSRIGVTSAYEAPTPVSVIGADDIKFSGTMNMEAMLATSPQFIGSTSGNQTSNGQGGNGDSGAAWVNLRGLGEVRNLVLVNGRRFVIQGTRMTTDINTIPANLVERTEIVTGGNSAVYGSDAISGVVNFVMKKDFEGVEGDAEYKFDQFTTSPIYNFDLTMGGNFDHDKGNIVMAVNYMSRRGFTDPEHGHWLATPLADGCVTATSYTPSGAGTLLNSTTGAACVASGGVNGMYTSGSTDVYNGYINQIPTYASADATLKADYAAAGLTGMTTDGLIFTNTGAALPGTIRNRNTSGDLYTADKFNTIATNYMQIPQQRWMLNTFARYSFDPKIEGYTEFHFSSNTIAVQLTPSNASGFMLFNTHNPAFPAALQSAFDYMDSRETATAANPACFAVGPATNNVCTYKGDGLVNLGWGKRFLENGKRRQNNSRVAWRFLGGFRGDLGSVGTNVLKDISYDVYYTFSHTNETDRLSGSISKSKLQANVLASTNGGTPVCDLFGIGALSAECISAITVNSTVLTQAEMQDLNASVTGTAFDLPAGPVQFAVGGEWRYQMAEFVPDEATRTGDVAGLTSAGATPKGAIVAHEAYGEMKIPVLADLPLVEKFTVNGAFRFSEYNLSAAKNIWTWSLGGDWKVISDLTFRGQFQHAIRAPNVGELYGGFQSRLDLITDPCGARSTTKTSAVAAMCVAQGVSAANVWTSAVQSSSDYLNYITGGSPTLKPETSDTITMGVVITPEAVPGLATSIDFYSLDLRNMIAPLGGGVTGVLNNCFGQSDPNNLYCQQIHRVSGLLNGGSGGYVNAANGNISAEKTQGFDLNGQYHFGIDWGVLTNASTFDVGTSWNWLLEMTQLPDVTAPTVKNECAGAYGNTYCFYEPTPRLKGTSRITWNDGPVSLSLKWRYIGSVSLDRYLVPLRRGTSGIDPVNFTRPFLPDMNYFDVAASWDINDSIEIYGGINNLFSKDPPIVGSAASLYPNSFPATYDGFGRVTYIGIKARTD